MICKQIHLVRLSGRGINAVASCIVLLTTFGMISTVSAQAGRTFTMPSPEIILVPTEPEGAAAPQVILVTRTCSSEVNITYEQRNTLARVEGIVESSSCPASHGEYTFVIGIRDENNEQSTLEFTETWQRDDDEPLSFVKEYPIGENVDLTRVRLRSLRCSCDELPVE
jgi:hypothetical protein